MSLFDLLKTDGRPLLMAIVNITPDSFSDGGRFLQRDSALDRIRSAAAEGADVMDLGAESTRPGAAAVSTGQQLERLLPVLEQLDAPAISRLSIDTRSPEVAREVLARGVPVINDVAAGMAAGMLETVSEQGAGMILMHMQGSPRDMQDAPSYKDVVGEVRDFLLRRVDAALAAGIRPDRIAIDPGIGFGKSRRHNLELMQRLDVLVATGLPVLLGTSRKRFMGAICAGAAPHELVAATCATTALGVAAGVRVFRVHDVRDNRQALDVSWACQSVTDSADTQ